MERLAPTQSHPWDQRYSFDQRGGGLDWDIIGPESRIIYNSAIPYGDNDGAVWAARGLTTVATGGAALRYGPISLTLAPVAFWTQNTDFPLAESMVSGSRPYADPKRPNQIDLPQRFGDGAYARLDPGQSGIRVEGKGVAAGLTWANEIWGPSGDYALLLGANAPGFLHGYLGTQRPLNIRIGELQSRILWGRIGQSEYSPVSADSAYRFATGLFVAFSPGGVDGLQIGAMRFFHMPWSDSGFGRSQLLAPIETFLKDNLVDKDLNEVAASILANQIAGAFFQWVFQESRFEVYGEFTTEDHRHNLRDLTLEPEHASGYALGMRKSFETDRTLWQVRGELVDAAASHLQRGRRQEPFYVHASTRQGHTNLGQLIGSPAAYGGGGSTIGIDAYRPEGRGTLQWIRTVRGEQDAYLETGLEDRPDVMNSLNADFLFFRGRLDLNAGLTFTYDANRNFVGDVVNLNAVIGVKAEL